MISTILVAVIAVALLFEFINGFHDTANAIATSVYTRALTAGKAIALAAIMNFFGALVSENVAKTISQGLVGIALEEYVVLGALLGAIIWNLLTWWKGIPSSSSHALIGALVGAAIVYTAGPEGIIWSGVLQKVIVPLVTSPFIGFFVGFGIMKLIFVLCQNSSPGRVNGVFAKLQIATAALVAFSHGTNDAQKTMGIITLALVSGGMLPETAGVPMWVKIACAACIAGGTSVGGWKIMKTMGGGVTKLQPPGGFAAQASSTIVIELMSHLGAPISTTHVITSSVMGVGSAKRLSAVKWGKAKDIVLTWVITLPIAAALGGICTAILRLFL
ncbi:MAG: inorganic phosphate transporter [Clostridiales Family XIII bacterium]|jgi:PiT family inorganic phosphate transporter|nr:inorganic phosphate transporter [Clostridiales Family XIII bacterium]